MPRHASCLLFAIVLGCAPDVNPSGGDPGSGAGAAGASGGSSGATMHTSGSGTPFDAGGVLSTFDARIGPISVAPGQEAVQCIRVRLQNPEGAFVRRFRGTLTQASHHMVVYRSNATDEVLTPFG